MIVTKAALKELAERVKRLLGRDEYAFEAALPELGVLWVHDKYFELMDLLLNQSKTLKIDINKKLTERIEETLTELEFALGEDQGIIIVQAQGLVLTCDYLKNNNHISKEVDKLKKLLYREVAYLYPDNDAVHFIEVWQGQYKLPEHDMVFSTVCYPVSQGEVECFKAVKRLSKAQKSGNSVKIKIITLDEYKKSKEKISVAADKQVSLDDKARPMVKRFSGEDVNFEIDYNDVIILEKGVTVRLTKKSGEPLSGELELNSSYVDVVDGIGKINSFAFSTMLKLGMPQEATFRSKEGQTFKLSFDG